MNISAHPLPNVSPSLRWTEYAIEALGLGLFMLSACAFGVLLDLEGGWGQQAISDPLLRRMLFGIAMGLTAISIIYSPAGQRSGAHLNPATTLTFFRLGKVRPHDALAYIAAQVLGGSVGVALASFIFGPRLADPSVHYVVTRPGAFGEIGAFVAELAISFGLMTVVLTVSNTPRIARFTGLCAGALVATYITFEAPISGMSMNPARSLASALSAQDWTAIWVYLTAPIIGMLLAAEARARIHGPHSVLCAKLHHPRSGPCIFHCRFPAA